MIEQRPQVAAVLEEPLATVAEAIEASGLGWSVGGSAFVVDRRDEPNEDWSLPRYEEIPAATPTVRQDTHAVARRC